MQMAIGTNVVHQTKYLSISEKTYYNKLFVISNHELQTYLF